MKLWIAVGLVCLPLAAAWATDERRELGAHEHGHGSFNIAIEGKKVAMELVAPGADIVGFEHKAKTSKQKAAVTEATKTLQGVANVVGLPAAAGCNLTKASVELHIEGDDHDDHGKAEKKKKHAHGHDHGHKESAKKKQDETHSEFHATYALTCAAPEKLVEITFPYFKSFKGAEELEVSIAGPKSQKKFEVGRDNAKISLGGII